MSKDLHPEWYTPQGEKIDMLVERILENRESITHPDILFNYVLNEKENRSWGLDFSYAGTSFELSLLRPYIIACERTKTRHGFEFALDVAHGDSIDNANRYVRYRGLQDAGGDLNWHTVRFPHEQNFTQRVKNGLGYFIKRLS